MAIEGSSDLGRYQLLTAATATGAGDWYRLPRNKSIQIDGIGTATVKIQGTHDRGATPYDLLETTADGMWDNEYPYYYVRANVTAYTSGTINVWAVHDDN